MLRACSFLMFFILIYGDLLSQELFIKRAVSAGEGKIALVLSDKSVLEVSPFKVRGQYWSEWFAGKGVDLPEEQFVTDCLRWDLTSSVKVISYDWKVISDQERTKFNDPQITAYNLMVRHEKSGKCVFARKMDNDGFINILLALDKDNAVQTGGLYIKKALFLSYGKAVFWLSDGAIFEALRVYTRSQTWSEWWRSIEVKPPEAEFLTDFTKWDLSSLIELVSIDWSAIPTAEIEKYNNGEITRCNFVLRQEKTSDCAFVRKIDSQELYDFFSKVIIDEYNAGYAKGHEEGYRWGHSIGYNEGYTIGYLQGQNASK